MTDQEPGTDVRGFGSRSEQEEPAGSAEAHAPGAKKHKCLSQGGPDVATYLQEQKRALSAQRTVRPMTAEERQTAEDIAWAQHDPEVQAQHRGEFVVP
jgi:hypothetical protein